MSDIQVEAIATVEMEPGQRRSLPLGLVVGLIYALLVLLMWGPLGWKQGMPYETAFAFMSQSESWWHAFIYWADPMRPYTNVFYQLSYLLSGWLGIKGSFLAYQLVYIALWWARGWLTFLIFQRLLATRTLFNFMVGSLVICHASDHALNWVGQLNQFGMIFWMVLSVYLLVRTLDTRRLWAAGLWLIGAMLACRLSLWSYESELFIICVVPLLLIVMRYGLSRRTAGIVLIYWIIPLAYIGQTARHYFGGAGSSSYQESVMRHDFTAAAVSGDWLFNVDASLRFWDWGAAMPHSPYYRAAEGWIIGAIAGVVLLLGMGLPQWRRPDALPTRRQLAKALIAGLIVLALSFPAYLILSSARGLWRTQFLSGLGAAMVLASLLGLLAVAMRNRAWRIGVMGVGGAAIALFAASAAYAMSDFHYGIWERHRKAVAEVLHVAPRVRDGTVIVLTNVPKAADPFGDVMWFDMALRLAYPHHQVSGVYYYADHTRPPGYEMEIKSGQWKYSYSGFAPMVLQSDLSNTVVIEYEPAGDGRLLDQIPEYVTSDPARANYNPGNRIYGIRPDHMARLRYVR